MYQRKSRIYEYDVMKSLSILLVVLGHSYYLGSHGATVEGIVSISDNAIVWFFNSVINPIIYSFHMPLYMFISGALAYGKGKKNFKDFVRGRFKRLMIPFFVCNLLYAVPLRYFSGYYEGKGLFSAYLDSIILMRTPAHLWFLYILFFLSIIFSYIEKKKWEDKKILLLVVLGLYFIHDYMPGGAYGLYKLTQHAIFYYCGMKFEQLKLRDIFNRIVTSKSVTRILPIGIFSLTLVIEEMLIPLLSFPKAPIRNCFGLVAASCGIYAIYWISHLIVERNRQSTFLIRLLADNNFEIYLYHEPVIHVCTKLFLISGFAYYMVSSEGYFLSIVIKFISSLGIALLVGNFVKYITRVEHSIKRKIGRRLVDNSL